MFTIARILLLATALAATISASTQTGTVTRLICSAQLASTSHIGAIKTSTVTSVLASKSTTNVVITKTPVKTVQGQLTIITITSTTTSILTITKPTSTGTRTSTLTLDKTVTSTVATITSTATKDSGMTVSSTFTVATRTLPTPAGYTGIKESSGQQNAVVAAKGKKRRSLLANVRQVPAAHRRSSVSLTGRVVAGSLLERAVNSYPQQVLCTKLLETVVTVYLTSSAPTRTVTEPRSKSTATTTSTVTSTSTRVPSATTTRTVTKTNTITSSATHTNTITTTTTATTRIFTTTTEYAACATNYLLGPALLSGLQLNGFSSPNFDYKGVNSPGTSAYDCCVTCQTSTNVCYGSYFSPGNCLIFINDNPDGPGGVCDPAYMYGNLQSYSNNGGYVVANGPCGKLGPRPT